MKRLKSLFILVLFAAAFVSCEEVIEVDLNNAPPELSIEGNISDSTGPYYVNIAMTVGFSQSNNSANVSGAFVTMSDYAGLTDTLTELSAGKYATHNILGMSSASYILNAVVDGKYYTSISLMPARTNLDSVYTTTNGGGGFGGGGGKKIAIVPKYHDLAGVRNFYKFVLYINGVQTDDVFVQKDEGRDGQVISQPLRSHKDINTGDLLTLEMQCIDENVYNYFHALSLNFRRGLNQTQSPTNPPTNITGAKLGYFSAHTTQRKSCTAR